jgi:hypothetical protein
VAPFRALGIVVGGAVRYNIDGYKYRGILASRG